MCRPAAQVRLVDQHLPVEAPRTQERGVEYLGPVGRRHDDDALPGVETVHLDQELVERLLALVVPAREVAHAARLSEGVQLVHEDDAGGLLHRLLKEIAHARGAQTHEHLHELRTADAEEKYARLSRHGLRHERLPAAGRPHQQDAARNLAAQAQVAVRIFQVIHHLGELRLGFVHARHVCEAHPHFLFRKNLRLVLAEGHHPLAGAHAPQHERVDGEENRQGQHPARENLHQPGRLELALEGDAGALQQLDELGVGHLGRLEEPLLPVRVSTFQDALQPVAPDVDALHVAFFQHGAELVVGDALIARALEEERVDERHDDEDEEKVPDGKLRFLVHRPLLRGGKRPAHQRGAAQT